MTDTSVDCRRCTHFRSAPYEARMTGCYLPDNMPGKQDAFYLDEQQIAGRHDKLNRDGDCADFQTRDAKPSFLKRVLAK